MALSQCSVYGEDVAQVVALDVVEVDLEEDRFMTAATRSSALLTLEVGGGPSGGRSVTDGGVPVVVTIPGVWVIVFQERVEVYPDTETRNSDSVFAGAVVDDVVG